MKKCFIALVAALAFAASSVAQAAPAFKWTADCMYRRAGGPFGTIDVGCPTDPISGLIGPGAGYSWGSLASSPLDAAPMFEYVDAEYGTSIQPIHFDLANSWSYQIDPYALTAEWHLDQAAFMMSASTAGAGFLFISHDEYVLGATNLRILLITEPASAPLAMLALAGLGFAQIRRLRNRQ